MDYRRSLVYSPGARHRLGNHTVDKSRVQWIRGRAKSFFICLKIWIVPSIMDNGNLRGFSGDGGAIGENPLSMDGLLLEGMRFSAMDGWSIAFIKFRIGWVGCAIEG